MEIKLNNENYKSHKIYNLFASNEYGKIINIVKKRPLIGTKGRDGFYKCLVRKHAQNGNTIYKIHDFIWECHFNLIPKSKTVVHINKDTSDNRLCNLKLINQKKNDVYNQHPIYSNYGSNKDGMIMNIDKKRLLNGNKRNNGYITITVRNNSKTDSKTYQLHRFVWECFHGIIPDKKVIDHIDDDKTNNQLNNLHLMSQQENCKKSAKNRDYSFASKNHKNKRCVKAINQVTNDVSYYNSMHSIQKHLCINAGIVKMVCEGLNNCKTGISKKDGQSYKFEYICENELPENYIKSPNIRSKRLSDENRKLHQKECQKRWMQKSYSCHNCNQIIKNGIKYYHKQKCK